MLRVTEALKLAGLVDTEWMTPEGAKRGTYVHEATALDDAGTLDPTYFHEEVSPRVDSWRRFKAETGLVVAAIELEVVHAPLGYAGRLDRIVRFPGDDRPTVIDLKNGSQAKWHRIQTALYALAWCAQTGQPTPHRGAVYLHPDGRAATLWPHRERSDFQVAQHVVALASFLKEK